MHAGAAGATGATGAVWRVLGAAASRVRAASGACSGRRTGAPPAQAPRPLHAPLAARVAAAAAAAGRRASSSAPELVVAPKVAPPGLVRSFKEELWRRQRVATTYFPHPVAALEEVKPDAGQIELAAAVFRQEQRLDILNRVVLWQRAKKRVIARPAKTRAMVAGGGKKPWRQKGSGRARHGSNRCVRVGGVRSCSAVCVRTLRLHAARRAAAMDKVPRAHSRRGRCGSETPPHAQVADLEGWRQGARAGAALLCL